MSKKNSAAAMERALAKARAERDQIAAKAKKAAAKATEIRQQVRQIQEEAAKAGVDLNALPASTKKKAAQVADVPAPPAEVADKRSTAERLGEHITVTAPGYGPRYVRTRADQRPRSADKLTHEVILGLDDRYADPSRNALPTGPHLRPTAEVIADQQQRAAVQTRVQTDQPQYRQPVGQTRTVSPQATTRSPLHRPWGAGPGQLGGVNVERALAARAQGTAR